MITLWIQCLPPWPPCIYLCFTEQNKSYDKTLFWHKYMRHLNRIANVYLFRVVKAEVEISNKVHDTNNPFMYMICGMTIFSWGIFYLGSSKPLSVTLICALSISGNIWTERDKAEISNRHTHRLEIDPYNGGGKCLYNILPFSVKLKINKSTHISHPYCAQIWTC